MPTPADTAARLGAIDPTDPRPLRVVVGGGEVGRAVAEVLATAHRVYLRDLEGEDGEAAVLHVAIPYTPRFEEHVRAHAARYRPGLVVVHSTVPAGTCARPDAVHSPITGKHPNLRVEPVIHRPLAQGAAGMAVGGEALRPPSTNPSGSPRRRRSRDACHEMPEETDFEVLEPAFWVEAVDRA